jgi:hypothetical protein
MSSTPMAVRLRSPPEMPLMSAPPMRVSAHFSSFSSASSASTLAVRAAAPSAAPERSAAEKCSASRGVCVFLSASSCMTYAMLPLKDTGSMTRPRKRTSPPTLTPLPAASLLLLMRPARMLSSDVLPAPDGPMSAVRLWEVRPVMPWRISFPPAENVMPDHSSPRCPPAVAAAPTVRPTSGAERPSSLAISVVSCSEP